MADDIVVHAPISPDYDGMMIFGPMWQAECSHCGQLCDCWGSESEAVSDMANHDCLSSLPSWARDEIKRLRSEVARLGAFLHPIGEQARRG